jgi:hypothetical protein
VRRLAGWLIQRRCDDGADPPWWRRPRAWLSGFLAQQASHAVAHEPLLPESHTEFRDPGAPHASTTANPNPSSGPPIPTASSKRSIVGIK